MGDFGEFLSFRRMITPIIIQILFWIGVVVSVIAGLVMLIRGAASGGGAAMVISGLLWMFLGPVMTRVYCEMIVILFRIEENTRYLRPGGVQAGGGSVPSPPESAGL
ncbi:MAG: DUF4282 domain-containing protein [Proteobacteria bacterium]|nr:DUF4282 domain-containing protein [Pseudomonadota bacterium]